MNTEETGQDGNTSPSETELIPNESQSLAREFVDFIRYNKAWWMTPIILVLALMVGFILLAESSPILPFIYTVI
ncbi:MAG: hypothetical protein CMK59_07730 [Proteobacteria bacterium]|nr:hypothetical protein [Pseudomonadota bacterium]